MIGNASIALGNLFAGLRLTPLGAKQGGEAVALDFGSVVAGLGQPEGEEQATAAPLPGDAGVAPVMVAAPAAPVDELMVEGAPTAPNDEAAAPELLSLIEQLQDKPVVPPTILPVAEGRPAGTAAPVSPETLLPTPVKGKKLLAVEPTELLAEASVEVTRGGVISTEKESIADKDEQDAEPVLTARVQADAEPSPVVIALPPVPTIVAAPRAGRPIYMTTAPVAADRTPSAAQTVRTQPVAEQAVAATAQAEDLVPARDQTLAATTPAPAAEPGVTFRAADIGAVIWEPVPARPVFAAPAFVPAAPVAVDQNGAIIAPSNDQPITVPVEAMTPITESSTNSAATPDSATSTPAPARTDSLVATASQPAVTPAVPPAILAAAAPVVDLPTVAVAVAPPSADASLQVIGHHLDLARDSAWLDQLARDIVSAGANDAKLQFKLNPEHLGSLHVELMRGDDGASVRMTTETEAARSALSDAQGRLIAEARAQGMKITETHVDLSQQGGRDQGQRGWADGQSGQPQSQPQPARVNATVTMKALDAELADRRAIPNERYA